MYGTPPPRIRGSSTYKGEEGEEIATIIVFCHKYGTVSRKNSQENAVVMASVFCFWYPCEGDHQSFQEIGRSSLTPYRS